VKAQPQSTSLRLRARWSGNGGCRARPASAARMRACPDLNVGQRE